MTFPEIAIFALIAVTVLYLLVVLARGRTRAAARKQRRSDRLHDAADPARGGGPTGHEAESRHDPAA